jgi:hypothetical protein
MGWVVAFKAFAAYWAFRFSAIRPGVKISRPLGRGGKPSAVRPAGAKISAKTNGYVKKNHYICITFKESIL